ncbi:hypothetical protein [Planctomyces sp. SH-PL62]|uniref:hypothetical protein n=1 Tax=Planctomyces sp. SH-PL62 TaxID=1636152 RepID=UPI00078D0359|nr:hypothetical protein [Planctomyces sp. SH-PL62]AMV36345.1 hypothetical protein VT85_02825 [Planctomyces sp. SH-PL62]
MRFGFAISEPGWLGPILSGIRLNRVERRLCPDRAPLIAKRRRWYSPWLIAPGNLYLRWLEAGVLVLPDHPWRDWERAVHRRLYGIECEIDPQGWLLLPLWPGVALDEHANDLTIPLRERLHAIATAVRALKQLHEIETRLLDGEIGRLSHGDATLRNVVYDRDSSRARWFDFDTVHEPSSPPIARRADDLRAVLHSALEAVRDATVSDLFETVRAAYDERAVWDHVRGLLARGSLHASPFHLAQARPPLESRKELERLIRRGG